MVGHEDIRAPRIGMDVVHDPELPERVQISGQDRRFSEDAPDPVPVGVGAARRQAIEKDEGSPQDDDQDVTRPDQERKRGGEELVPEHAGIIGGTRRLVSDEKGGKR